MRKRLRCYATLAAIAGSLAFAAYGGYPQFPSRAAGRQVTVYVTRNGTKYHRENCRHLKKSKIPMTLELAKARGYQPCKVCDPPK